MTVSSDERHAAKLERKAESRRRAQMRDAKRDQRDQKLREEADTYLARVKAIWADWRAS